MIMTDPCEKCEPGGKCRGVVATSSRSATARELEIATSLASVGTLEEVIEDGVHKILRDSRMGGDISSCGQRCVDDRHTR